MSKAERYDGWPIQSVPGGLKQFLTSLVPSQRPPQSAPDSRFRHDDRVWIDWLRIQIDVLHNTTLRGKVFVFSNAERRCCQLSEYPYAMVYLKSRDGTVPNLPTELNLKLLGLSNDRRQIGNTDGPFAYARNNSGNLVWKASDGEAFTAVMSRSSGQAVGDISPRVNSGPVKKKTTVLLYDLPILGEQGGNKRYHHLDFFSSESANGKVLKTLEILWLMVRTRLRYSSFWMLQVVEQVVMPWTLKVVKVLLARSLV